MNVFIVWLMLSIGLVGATQEGLDDKAAAAAASAYDITKEKADTAYDWTKDKLVKADQHVYYHHT